MVRQTKENSTENVLELKNITKTFLGGKILANNNISLEFKKSEIHSLVGENGSGKSTLMNILFGLYKSDSGSIIIDGKQVNMYHANAASKYKIGMVHQHYHLVDNFSVIDNILIGQENPNEDKEKILELKNDYLKAKENFIDYVDFLIGDQKKKLNEIISLEKKIIKVNFKRESLKNKIFYVEKLLKRDLSNSKIKKLENNLLFLKKKLQSVTPNEYIDQQKFLLTDKGVKKGVSFYRIKESKKDKYIGSKLTTFSYINKQKALARFKSISEKYSININPKAKINRLSVGERQMVEIMKVLWQSKKIIVFDEPTATLSIKEIAKLMKTIRMLQKQNKTIVFISHKLQEVKEISDRISILRKGEYLGTWVNNSSLNIKTISNKMVGKNIVLKYPKRNVEGENILEVKNLSFSTSSGFRALNDISFFVRKGEIFGLAGIEGNGQEEVLNILAGLLKPSSGVITFNGESWVSHSKENKMKVKPISERLKDYSHSPIDRNVYGMVPDKSLKFNSILSSFDSANFSKLFIPKKNNSDELKKNYYLIKDKINKLENNLKLIGKNDNKDKKIILNELGKLKSEFSKISSKIKGKNFIMNLSSTEEWTTRIINELKVDGAYENNIPIRNLSGGNQQKFVFGREILKPHKLLLAGHPTRGLDVSAIDHIYKKIIENAKNKATVLYSLELNELMAVCDRLAIFYKGKIIDIINPRKYSLERVSRLLVGEKNG